MRLRLQFLTVLAFFLAAEARSDTTIDLPIPEARALATQSALSGDPETARRIAAALLQADPNDRAALMVLAIVEPQLGRARQGRLAGARAYAVSVTNAEKYEAARLTALAAANEGRYTLSQWWLRRALTVAQTPADAAQTTADARGVRNLNPWSTSVELSFSPSGNVNGGAETRFNVIDGIPAVGLLSADAQALSGWSGTLNFSTRYRIAASASSQTTLSFRAYERAVKLSQSARNFLVANGSDATAADFSSASFNFGLRHDHALQNGFYGIGLDLGRVWSEADFDYSFARLTADRRISLSDTASLSFNLSLEQRWDHSENQDQWRYNLQTSWSRNLASGDQVSATIGFGAVDSDQFNDTSRNRTAQLGYAFGNPVGPSWLQAQVQLSAGLQLQDFDDYRVALITVPGGRQDKRIFASADLFFSGISYAGFAPVITLNAGRTFSNVSRFEHDDMSIGFAIRSTF
jgi:Surface lipoprotein assembly modifier